MSTILSATDMTIEELAARVGAVSLWRIRIDPLPGTATQEEVERIQREEGVLCELIDGVLVEKAVSSKTAFLAAEIARILGNFVTLRRPGWVLGADGYVWLFGTQLRAPDVSFLRREQLDGGQLPDEGYVEVAPALVVEVFSPGKTVKEFERNRNDFFAAGTQLFWIVFPDRQEIEVSAGPETHSLLRRGDLLDGGTVLPGLSIPVSDIFDAADLKDKTGPQSRA